MVGAGDGLLKTFSPNSSSLFGCLRHVPSFPSISSMESQPSESLLSASGASQSVATTPDASPAIASWLLLTLATGFPHRFGVLLALLLWGSLWLRTGGFCFGTRL